MVGQIARTSPARRPTSTVGRGSLSSRLSSLRPRIARCNLPAALCVLFAPCVCLCVCVCPIEKSNRKTTREPTNVFFIQLVSPFSSRLLCFCILFCCSPLSYSFDIAETVVGKETICEKRGDTNGQHTKGP